MRNPLVALALVVGAPLLGASGAHAEDPKSPPAPPKDGLVPVERFFHGKVLSLEGGAIELLYDFEDAAQLQDFAPSLPFRAIRNAEHSLKGGRLLFEKTGSLRHVAVFDGQAGATAVFHPRKPRDFGFAITEERESEVFTLYCLHDRYFSAGDNVHVPQNMVIKFIPRDPKVNKDGLQDWRYCGSRGQEPEVVVGKSYKVTVARNGLESRMTIGDDWESRGKEAGRDLTAMMVAVYGYDAHFEVDDLVVRGRLDPQWVERSRIDLTTWKPPAKADPAKEGPAAPALPEAAVARVRAQIEGYPLATKPAALAALLRDASLPAALRAEAAEKAKQVASKRIVPYLVDGLYSEDVDARRLSFDVLKSLTGKTFGFRADGPAESRKKAIQDVNEYLRKHAAEFQ